MTLTCCAGGSYLPLRTIWPFFILKFFPVRFNSASLFLSALFSFCSLGVSKYQAGFGVIILGQNPQTFMIPINSTTVLYDRLYSFQINIICVTVTVRIFNAQVFLVCAFTICTAQAVLCKIRCCIIMTILAWSIQVSQTPYHLNNSLWSRKNQCCDWQQLAVCVTTVAEL